MSNKFGIILKSRDNKYCVVVQRFYPNITSVLEYCNLKINNNDILAGLKLYREGITSVANNNGRGNPISSITGNKNLIIYGDSFNFKFGFPKGGRETQNRTGIDCALRELQQETSISLDRRVINKDRVINTKPNSRGQSTTYFLVNNYDGEKSIKAEPDFEDEISEVLWLTYDQIANLPKQNCSKEFKEVVSQLNRRRRPSFSGPLPIMRLPPVNVDERQIEIFTMAVVKSHYKRVGPAGLSKKSDDFIKNLANLIILTCQKNCAENEIKEIMANTTCKLVKRNKSKSKKRKSKKK